MVLKDLALQLKKLEEEILMSRISWDRQTKPFIVNYLNKIKETTRLNVQVLVDRCIINLESVIFCFRDCYCGLTYDPCDEQNIARGLKGDIKQKGAALHFDQRYNGQIIIWMEYPYVLFQDRPHEKKTEILASLAQHNLDVPTIDKSLQDFLSKVATWHRREYKPVLGNHFN